MQVTLLILRLLISFDCPYSKMPSRPNFLSKMKPSKISHNLPTSELNFNNKEDIRNFITDYVIHNIEYEASKNSSSLSYHPNTNYTRRLSRRNPKNHAIGLTVNVNHQSKKINIDLVSMLRMYLNFESQNKYRESRIEPLIVDILDFVDQLEHKSSGLVFEIDTSDRNKMEQQVVAMLIEKHYRDKSNRNHVYEEEEEEEVSSKAIARYMRVSYIDIEDSLKRKEKEFMLEVKENAYLQSQQPIGSFMLIPQDRCVARQQLNELIDSGQLFKDTQKLSECKEQSMINFYELNPIAYRSKKEEVYKNLDGDPTFSQVNTQLLGNSDTNLYSVIKDWIADINLSEIYYNRKFGKDYSKRVRNLNGGMGKE